MFYIDFTTQDGKTYRNNKIGPFLSEIAPYNV